MPVVKGHSFNCYGSATASGMGPSGIQTITDPNQYNRSSSFSFSFTTISSAKTTPSRSNSYPNVCHSKQPAMSNISVKAWLGNVNYTKNQQKLKGSSFLSKRPKARRAQSEPLFDDRQSYVAAKSPTHQPSTERRAVSVPLPPIGEEDVEMCVSGDNGNIPLSYGFARGASVEVSKADDEGLNNDGSDSSTTRQPSPDPTEILDPDSQDLMEELPSKGVKVYDYAYAAPYHNASPSSASTSNLAAATNPSIAPPLVTEVFDALRGLSEIDLRWSRKPRNRAVQGKTLRRLLDMGWLTDAEMRVRAEKMDYDALKEYDSRPKHPWRSYGPKERPCAQEREQNMKMNLQYWTFMDSQWEKYINLVEWEAQEQKLVDTLKAEQAKRGILYEPLPNRLAKGKGKARALITPHSPPGPSKRRLDENGEGIGGDATDGPSRRKGAGPKRRRFTPPLPAVQLLPGYTQQQFPAALHAATMGLKPTSSSSQMRAVTPPLEEEPSASQQCSPGRRLVHPKHQKGLRALGRTQTFVQLVT